MLRASSVSTWKQSDIRIRPAVAADRISSLHGRGVLAAEELSVKEVLDGLTEQC